MRYPRVKNKVLTLKLITTNSESYFLLVYYLTASLRALPALKAGALVAAIVIS